MRVILFWLLCSTAVYSQESAPGETKPEHPFDIKVSLLNLLNPIQTSADVLTDIPITQRWGIEFGVGWFFDSQPLAPNAGESYQGLRLRPAVKYYFLPDGKKNYYVSLAFKYNNIRNEKYVNLLRQGGQYTEWILQGRHIVSWGGAIRAGSQHYIGHSKHWILESFLGMGFRQASIRYQALPPDAEVIQNPRFFTFEREPGIYITGDFMIGLCLGWTIPARARRSGK